MSYKGYAVRFSKSECGNYTEDPLFCEDSGWGDEEANVVCKSEKNTAYGLGGKNFPRKLDLVTVFLL